MDRASVLPQIKQRYAPNIPPPFICTTIMIMNAIGDRTVYTGLLKMIPLAKNELDIIAPKANSPSRIDIHFALPS
ncbi:hypothetical protein XBKQ1_2610001 [Xenorhabdus bovienii str. kraussei Quebec]|uniref:Uncharacterized protein n=1 Tax=Xenorhabdus bovienii str. kraussei Quebec TaxID=1398203 RepID=A0A077PI25_XENBV|nr:hypothetical protein XBKQ1_2610001 [Xenorhabdus bovienii str. kraussei Quebec]